MNTKPISLRTHLVLDYALVATLLAAPTLLGLNKKARNLYAIEGLLLLPYLALTKASKTGKGLIPVEMHRKIDPFNIAQFAVQSFWKPIKKNKKTLAFNLAFTAIAGLAVALTDWKKP